MIIIGAKSLAKELFAALIWDDWDRKNLFFFDNVNSDVPDKFFGEFPVIRSWEELKIYFQEKGPEFLLGVGGIKTKYTLVNKLNQLGGTLCSFISKHALVGEYGNVLGEGVCILPNVIITCDVTIGDCTLINKATIISHDVRIGKYCSISPGAKIMSRTQIGNFTEVGTGAITLPGITLGNHCIVGAGAVVTRNFPDHSVIAGVPAKIINMNKEGFYV